MLAFHQLGDAVDDAIERLLRTLPDPAGLLDFERFDAIVVLTDAASRDPADKRGISLLADHIADQNPNVRTLVASAFLTPGYVDGLVDVCLRTAIARRLVAMSQLEPQPLAKEMQIQAATLLQELGLVDTSPATLERCKRGAFERLFLDFQPPRTVDLGPLVDPTRPSSSPAPISTGAKIALVGAAVASTALLAYVLLGDSKPRAALAEHDLAPRRRRVA